MRPSDAPPIADHLISSLNAEQRAAVLHGRGPALILAGAGSGKTRVLTHRIAGLISVGIPANQILALTFTNKAAREMKERVSHLLQEGGFTTQGQVTLHTFHAFGAAFLRRFADRLGRSEQFLIYDRDDQHKLVKEVLKQHKVELDREGFLDLVSAFDTAKQLGENAELAHCPPLDSRPGVDVKRLGWAYEQALQRADAFDFGDLIVKPLKLLSDYGELKAQIQARYRWLLVDEFQDTNRAQMMLLQGLCPVDGDLFVVGDDDQSIYAWRGAEVSNILGFNQYFPSAIVYKLQQNYRSKGNILNAANGVIRYNAGRMGKRLWTDQDEGNKITLYEAQSDYDEAYFVAHQIKALVESKRYKYSDIAILYRANSLSLTFENAFMATDLTIPYVIVRGRQFFERAEIKDALAYLRLLINPHDIVAYQRAISTEARGIGKASLERIVALSAELGLHLFQAAEEAGRIGIIKGKASSGAKSFSELYTQGRYLDHDCLSEQAEALLIEAKLYHPEHLSDMVDEGRRARCENLSRLIEMIHDFEEKSSDPTWFSFLEQVKLVSEDEEGGESESRVIEQGAVSLMTVHASKGLEFPVVFLVGLEEDLFPNARRGGGAELEEERRLFYVAVTRAEHLLVLSYALLRSMHGQRQARMMSRFVGEIDQNLLATSGRSQNNSIRRRGTERSAFEQRENALKAWAKRQYSQDKTPSRTAQAQVEVKGSGGSLSRYSPSRIGPASETDQKSCHQYSIPIGALVFHKTYGLGEVLSVEKKSRGEAARVKFGLTEKVILTSFLILQAESTDRLDLGSEDS